MSVYLAIDHAAPTILASNSGWNAFGEWADMLDVNQFLEVASFSEHGITEHAPILLQQLRETPEPQDADTAHTRVELGTLLHDIPDGAIVMVTDGMEKAGETGTAGTAAAAMSIPAQPPEPPLPAFTADEAIQLAIDAHAAAACFSWSPYQGAHGGKGWRNDGTGEIRYQRDEPKEGEAAGASDFKDKPAPEPNTKAPAPPQTEQELTTQADALADDASNKTAGLFKKLGDAGKWMRDRTQKVYSALEARYGKKQAILIFGAGVAVGMATPLVVVPGSIVIGMAPFAALAEVYLQARKAFAPGQQPAPAQMAVEAGSPQSQPLSFDEILALGKALVARLKDEWEPKEKDQEVQRLANGESELPELLKGR